MSKDDVVFERHGEDVFLPRDQLSCRITTKETALSVLAHNCVCQGDDFRDDGYVYGPDGKIRRKWFKEHYGYSPHFCYWHPKLENIKALESARFKAYSKYQHAIKTFWKSMFDTLKDKIVYGTRNGRELFIETTDRGLSWNYIEYAEPWGELETVQDQKLIDLHFDVEKRISALRRRYQILNTVFELAIRQRYFKDYPDQALLKLIVNERTYWIEFVKGKHEFSLKILNEADNIREDIIE